MLNISLVLLCWVPVMRVRFSFSEQIFSKLLMVSQYGCHHGDGYLYRALCSDYLIRSSLLRPNKSWQYMASHDYLKYIVRWRHISGRVMHQGEQAGHQGGCDKTLGRSHWACSPRHKWPLVATATYSCLAILLFMIVFLTGDCASKKEIYLPAILNYKTRVLLLAREAE